MLSAWIACAAAQAPPSPTAPAGQDVIVFTDGTKLIGELKSATGANLVFASNMGFEVVVGWPKVKELHSNKKFAAIPKDIVFRDSLDTGKVARGTIDLENQNLAMKEGPAAAPQTVPLSSVKTVIPDAAFERGMQKQSFSKGWMGGADLNIGLTRATSKITVINTGFNLSRSSPSQGWLETKNRTSISFFSSYNNTTSAYAPEDKVTVYHGDLVQDRFLTKRVFAFVGATFDHNSNQGLDFLQAYGGGIGAILYKSERSEFEMRAGVGFMDQHYEDPINNRRLVGSRFGQSYSHTFRNGINIFEQAGVRPAWNDMKYFFGGYNASLSVPIYRRLSLNVSSFDNFLYTPSPFRKKNVLQVAFGIHYSIR